MSSITNSPPGQRELVYCHFCREEWYRDEHGLLCPHCGSDFIEIIENSNDPRNPNPAVRGINLPEDFNIDDDDGPPMPRGHASAILRIEGPNFSYTSTQRNFGPRVQQLRNRTAEAPGERAFENPDEMMLQLFTTMLRNFRGDSPIGEGPRTPGDSPRTRSGLGSPHPHTPLPPIFGPPPPLFRFLHDHSARLSPRDADSPQPHDENVLDLSTLLASFFNPIAGGGDYVYSQEGLDRVISRLMEQHQGSGPPPATKDTIESLPKVKVTDQMVRDGQDCTVCKEDLAIGEEIRKLPCDHMYHFECISKWLEAHDTCPICRHPATPEDQRSAAPQSPRTLNRPSGMPNRSLNRPPDTLNRPPGVSNQSHVPITSPGPLPVPSSEPSGTSTQPLAPCSPISSLRPSSTPSNGHSSGNSSGSGSSSGSGGNTFSFARLFRRNDSDHRSREGT